MTLQQGTVQFVDNSATIEREKAMAVRNAYLALLRAWEDMHSLPRSVPTKVERGEVLPKTEHHNRG
jgi:cyanophycinase-like exopeptidase